VYYSGDIIPAGLQFRVLIAHCAGKYRDEFINERFFHPQVIIPIPDSAAENSSYHVSGFVIRRQLSVGYGEGHGPQMISNYPEGHIPFIIFAIRPACY
jgi:hypothetical protein